MSIKPLSEPGVPFTVSVTIDHDVSSLFVLPEGSFYTVESLLLDPTTGVPLKPLIDYMYFQQVDDLSLVTAKQVAAIIQIRNKDITNVIVKGKYTHGVTVEQINNWNNLCLVYKDAPQWLNWIGCLDDILQVHPNVKRTVDEPSLSRRTLSDVEVELNYIANQFDNGDSLYISHIEYWQDQLFGIAQNKYDQAMNDLNFYLNAMKNDIGPKNGDFLFTTGDASKWSPVNKNEYVGVTLKDRGVNTVGTYTYLPEGTFIPATKVRLFNKVTNVQRIQGNITTNKVSYLPNETISLTVQVSQLVSRVSVNTKVQIVDNETQEIIQEFPIDNFAIGEYNFQFNLGLVTVSDNDKQLIIRLPEYMWLNPAIVTIKPNTDLSKGYIKAELIGESNVGVKASGGYVNTIKVKFKRVGILTNPETLYVHLSGDYPNQLLKPGYSNLQTFNFPVDFTDSIVTIAEFIQDGETTKYYKAEVKVSKTQDPFDTLSIVNQNVWYITSFPINPYITWYFAVKEGLQYTRVTSVEEGQTLYAIGKLSIDASLYGAIPQLTVTSNGVGSAIEGVDFLIDRSTLINIDNETVAYKITLPLKPEQEIRYKFLNVKSINSNVADVWIVDKIVPAPIVASWHKSALLNSPIVDWVSETSIFYLHIEVPGTVDGTILNMSLASPEIYRNYLTFPSQVTIFAGIAIVEIKLAGPQIANLSQYLKFLITGPNINYTTLGLMVLDTSKPYYEIRYLVNGLADTVTAYPGDVIQCQARCIKDISASALAAVMLTGSANIGSGGDLELPPGTTSPLKSSTISFINWTDLFNDNVSVKAPMRLDYLSLTTNIIFPTSSDGVKQGTDSNLTLNLRKI